MQAIADLAGVSKMTVSRILSGSTTHRASTVAKVRTAARELGYSKNPMVSSLMSNLRSGGDATFSATIAMIHCNPAEPLWRQNLVLFHNAAKKQAKEKGYSIESYNFYDSKRNPEDLLRHLKQRRIHGIIWEQFPDAGAELDLDLSSFSSIALGFSIKKPNLHRVHCDQLGAAQLAFRQLRKLGYKRICFANLEFADQILDYRRNSAIIVEQKWIPKEERVPPIESPTLPGLKRKLMNCIRKYKPDVIVSLHARLYNHMIEKGISVPEEIGFAHLNALSCAIPFAGIDCNWETRGEIAVNQLIDMLNRNERGIPKDPYITYVEGKWMDGPTLRSKTG